MYELFIFPYHIIPMKSKVVIYGAGNVGKQFYRQSKEDGIVYPVAVVDSYKAGEKLYDNSLILDRSQLIKLDFDYVLISIKDINAVEEVKKFLRNLNIPDNKIRWDGTSYSADAYRNNVLVKMAQNGFSNINLLKTDNKEQEKYVKNTSNKKFIFSIVMSIYNVGQYIEEAVDSVISQDIGFENVQIVFVNDGSTDNSGEICKSYANIYPQNIVYVEKENGGLSSARNMGLNYVDAQYINFFDPDDILSSNVLSEVYTFFEKNKDFIDLVCVPLVYFEAQIGLHAKYKLMGNRNHIISLIKEPWNFVLSSASSFYKSDIIINKRFDERMVTGEDTKFNLGILKRTLKYGYVCEKNVQYNYRRRASGTSNVDKVRSGGNYEAFLAPSFIFEEFFSRDGDLCNYEKELIVYELRSRLRDIKKECFTVEQYDSLIRYYVKWINKLDGAFIEKSKWLDIVDKKALFLQLSNRKFGNWCREGNSDLSDRLIRLRNFEYDNENIVVSVIFNNFQDESLDLVLIPENGNNRVLFPYENKDVVNGPYDCKIGEFTADITHVRIFKIPLKNNSYRFAYYDQINKNISLIHRCAVLGKTRCAANVCNAGPVVNGYCISVKDALITITNKPSVVNNITKTLEREFKKELPYRYFSNENKKYILISDRPEKAGDNGQALFEYIMENEDENIRNSTYFVINQNSKEYYNLKYRDHVVNFRSKEHLYMFLNAKAIYSSHNAVAFLYPFDVSEFKYYADLLNYKFIWLQHGIIEKDVSKAANKLVTMDDIVVTSTNWEYKEVSSNRYLYNKDEVILTGLARYDKLKDNRKNIITIAPTWRCYLVGAILPNGHNEPKAGFEKTLFYLNYVELLTNHAILETIERLGYEIHFVLHSGFTCYENLFDKVNSDNVKMIRMEDFSYQKAFCESSLWITDFSSTAFDAAYLKHPVIYFQFDEEEFFSNHYERSSFKYSENGFGPVIYNIDDMVNTIIEYLENGCVMQDKYRERVDNTFAYRDNNNCKRIMDATRKFL